MVFTRGLEVVEMIESGLGELPGILFLLILYFGGLGLLLYAPKVVAAHAKLGRLLPHAYGWPVEWVARFRDRGPEHPEEFPGMVLYTRSFGAMLLGLGLFLTFLAIVNWR
jgi:hypothetical protein